MLTELPGHHLSTVRSEAMGQHFEAIVFFHCIDRHVNRDVRVRRQKLPECREACLVVRKVLERQYLSRAPMGSGRLQRRYTDKQFLFHMR